MNVTLNGDPAALGDRATVMDALEKVGRKDTAFGVAVARNGEVVPKTRWAETSLVEGDRIEILAAVQGG
jgi:sulfur carrier protein